VDGISFTVHPRSFADHPCEVGPAPSVSPTAAVSWLLPSCRYLGLARMPGECLRGTVILRPDSGRRPPDPRWLSEVLRVAGGQQSGFDGEKNTTSKRAF